MKPSAGFSGGGYALTIGGMALPFPPAANCGVRSLRPMCHRMPVARRHGSRKVPAVVQGREVPLHLRHRMVV